MNNKEEIQDLIDKAEKYREEKLSGQPLSQSSERLEDIFYKSFSNKTKTEENKQ